DRRRLLVTGAVRGRLLACAAAVTPGQLLRGQLDVPHERQFVCRSADRVPVVAPPEPSAVCVLSTPRRTRGAVLLTRALHAAERRMPGDPSDQGDDTSQQRPGRGPRT